MEIKRYHSVRNLIYITLGALFFASGLVFFLIPNKIVTGGVAGLSIVGHYLSGFSTGAIMLILNLPLLVIGLKYFGGKFLLRTIYAIILASFLTDFFIINLHFERLTDQLMLATIYGGVMVGIGLALVFKADVSAGGGTVIARIISQKTRFKTGRFSLL